MFITCTLSKNTSTTHTQQAQWLKTFYYFMVQNFTYYSDKLSSYKDNESPALQQAKKTFLA